MGEPRQHGMASEMGMDTGWQGGLCLVFWWWQGQNANRPGVSTQCTKCTAAHGVRGWHRHQTPALLTALHTDREGLGLGVSQANKIQMQREVGWAFSYTGYQLAWEQRIIPTESSGLPSPDFLEDSCDSQSKELPDTA